jgi:hypothetical protein
MLKTPLISLAHSFGIQFRSEYDFFLKILLQRLELITQDFAFNVSYLIDVS